MPTLELTNDELIVRLTFWEAVASLHNSIRTPLKNVRGATDDEGFRALVLGIRSRGTNVPGLISAGTYRKSGHRHFVFVTRKGHPLSIELPNEKWARIIVGVADARGMAVRINAAIQQR